MESVNLLRKVLILLLALLVLVVLLLIFQFTDVVFAVWTKLQQVSGLFLWGYFLGVALIAGAGMVLGYKIWTVGRAKKQSDSSSVAAITLESLKQRLADARSKQFEFIDIEEEIALLEQAHAPVSLEVAFFGQVSTGKSSLIQTLIPDAQVEIDVIGGSTAQVARYAFQAGEGVSLTLLDMPGTHQMLAGEQLAQEIEFAARRAHFVVYVSDKDLMESDLLAISRLQDLDKPMIAVLNKTNLYLEEEKQALLRSWRARLDESIVVVSAVSGFEESVVRRYADGRSETVKRWHKGAVGELVVALAQMAGQRDGLLDRQKQALLALADERLSQQLQLARRERGEALVKAFARKAMLGGVAAVGPGTDVLIQGYLGMEMLKKLTELYGVTVKEVDLQTLIAEASGRIRSQLTLILALAGNVAKAFPGVGTVLGGASHALAYGLIFESLGKAVLQALEKSGGQWSADKVLVNFNEQLSHDLEKRAKDLVEGALKR